MAIKKYKPTTPGRRQMTVVDYSGLSSAEVPKRLVRPIPKKSGRNNQGKITVRHRGGGVKRQYRLIDQSRTGKTNVPAVVEAIQYDPNRTAFIALLRYEDGERRYILAPDQLKEGDQLVCSPKAKVKLGNRMQLRNIPVGYDIHDLELHPGKGSQAVRSAGAAAKITSLDTEMAQVMLPSGSVRFVSKDCYATLGIVSNLDHSNVNLGKAGRKRLMGWRPEVLGKSMNAVDHPHGGGEGHSPIGLKSPKTPWGLPALGVKTRRRKKHSDHLIVRGRRKKNA